MRVLMGVSMYIDSVVSIPHFNFEHRYRFNSCRAINVIAVAYVSCIYIKLFRPTQQLYIIYYACLWPIPTQLS